MKVELKGIKMAGGDETPRFETTLYLDGVKAAVVWNGGTGGRNEWHWLDRTGGVSALSAKFTAYAKEKLPDEKFEIEDQIVNQLLDDADYRKRMKRLCANKTLCHLPGWTYREGEWSEFKVKFDTHAKSILGAKYGEGITYLNESL